MGVPAPGHRNQRVNPHPCKLFEMFQLGNAKRGNSILDILFQKITYAQSVIAEAAPQVTFRWETANAFRMKIEQRFDLVWSAGLFDYLDERTATLLLKKMWSWTADGGELIVGNFHVSNQDRPWMEWCGNWRLIHRTEEDMFNLCDQAKIPLDDSRFYFEPMGVNMFLRVRKGS